MGGRGLFHWLPAPPLVFKEWKFNADGKTGFAVIEDLNRRYGIHDLASQWRFVSVLNFYREDNRDETIAKFEVLHSRPGDITDYPLDKRGYVLFDPSDLDFIKTEKLKIVYRGETTAWWSPPGPVKAH
ncbi:MAG TPA: hypothetical protein VKV15_03970 [Bryobacteraceae bacterium]|nr:hypothetical protein [Bryobacteraceae bacterium]